MKQAGDVGPKRPAVYNAARILQRAENLVEGSSHITEYDVLLSQVVLEGVHELVSLQQSVAEHEVISSIFDVPRLRIQATMR